MLKIKRRRTVDCVVGGVIFRSNEAAGSHILLGLYDGELLHFIGSAPLRAGEGRELASIVANAIEAPDFTGRMPGQFGHRISGWHPLEPALVAEVEFDHFTEGRFRHGAKFVRWRPDKNAGDCLMAQT